MSYHVRLLSCGAAAVAALLAPNLAGAQEPRAAELRADTPAFLELCEYVNRQTEVMVRTDAGKGVYYLPSLGSGGLEYRRMKALDGPASQGPLPVSGIREVRVPDNSVKEGALIGMGVGLGFTVIALISNASESDDSWFKYSTGEVLLSGLLLTGLTTAIGVGIDALSRDWKTVYRQ